MLTSLIADQNLCLQSSSSVISPCKNEHTDDNITQLLAMMLT